MMILRTLLLCLVLLLPLVSCKDHSTDTADNPTIQSMTPSSVVRGQTNVRSQITGTNFTGVVVVDIQPGITVQKTTLVSSTQINVRFLVAPDAPVGPVRVSVFTTGGSASHEGLLNIQENLLPTASFNVSPGNIFRNDPVSFDASASTDPDGTISSYDWNFGDGQTGSGMTATHTYTSAGTFTVTLTVTDNRQGKGTATRNVQVGTNAVPHARFTVTPHSGLVDTEFHFDATESSDSDGTISSYDWRFGDGQVGTGRTVSHTYTAAHDYTVTLTVTDNHDAKGTTTRNVTVIHNSAPHARFSFTPRTGKVNTVFHFDASESSDPDGELIRYDWNFGDGETTRGKTVQHRYSHSGNYDVTLMVTDNHQAQGSISKPLEVQGTAPVADFSVTPSSGDVHTDFVFDGSASHDEDGTIAAYAWSFGDGATSSGVTTQHRYSTEGSYTARLTVVDSSGLQGTAERTVIVGQGIPPGGVECTHPVVKGRAWYGKVLSVDVATNTFMMKFYDNVTCENGFFKCGDLDAYQEVRWYGIICRMRYYGDSTFAITTVAPKAYPTPGEENVFMKFQDCSEDPCH